VATAPTISTSAFAPWSRAVNINLGLLPAGTISFGLSTTLTQVESGKLELGSGNDTIQLGTTLIKVYAGDGNDIITGTSASEEVWGEAGNDTIDGLGGNDKLWAATATMISTAVMAMTS
jgi:Ca2+-binding RTX toxin-like protein